MYNIALFGGSFDPIGLHHENIAKAIKENFDMPTLIMPCYGHLFEKGEFLESSEHRWIMVCLAADEKRDFMIAFFHEIEQKHKGSMYETLNRIKKINKEYTYHIVIGTDNANVIEERWHIGNSLIDENPFIVVERKGVSATTDWFLKSPHKTVSINSESSSSAIRESIKNGNYKFAEQNLSPSVFQYIKDNSLYGFKA